MYIFDGSSRRSRRMGVQQGFVYSDKIFVPHISLPFMKLTFSELVYGVTRNDYSATSDERFYSKTDYYGYPLKGSLYITKIVIALSPAKYIVNKIFLKNSLS